MEYDKPIKLNWLNKWKMRTILKRARKQHAKGQKIFKDQVQYRKMLVSVVKELSAIFNYEQDGKEMTDKDIEKLNTTKLEELHDKSLKELEKIT